MIKIPNICQTLNFVLYKTWDVTFRKSNFQDFLLRYSVRSCLDFIRDKNLDVFKFLMIVVSSKFYWIWFLFVLHCLVFNFFILLECLVLIELAIITPSNTTALLPSFGGKLAWVTISCDWIARASVPLRIAAFSVDF